MFSPTDFFPFFSVYIYIYIYIYIYTASQNKLHKLCQNFVKCPSISIIFCRYTDDRTAKVLYHIYISHLTQLISPHYLVKHKSTRLHSVSQKTLKTSFSQNFLKLPPI